MIMNKKYYKLLMVYKQIIDLDMVSKNLQNL